MALDLYRRAASSFDAPSDIAHSLRHVGDLARELGDSALSREALDDAEVLYRTRVSDPLALANTVRLLALLDGDHDRWREAGMLYRAAAAQGLDLTDALAECKRNARN